MTRSRISKKIIPLDVQALFQRYINRCWMRRLSPADYILLMYCFDRTIGWQRFRVHMKVREIIDGHDAHPGVQLSERTIRQSLRNLAVRKLITTVRTPHGLWLTLQWREIVNQAADRPGDPLSDAFKLTKKLEKCETIIRELEATERAIQRRRRQVYNARALNEAAAVDNPDGELDEAAKARVARQAARVNRLEQARRQHELRWGDHQKLVDNPTIPDLAVPPLDG